MQYRLGPRDVSMHFLIQLLVPIAGFFNHRRLGPAYLHFKALANIVSFSILETILALSEVCRCSEQNKNIFF